LASLKRYALALIALLVASATPAPFARAQDSLHLVEQDIKAGLLYNFLRYTQWPQQGQAADAVVCIYGHDPFNGRLTPMAGRTVNQRTIEIRMVHDNSELSACSLLFVNSDERSRWSALHAYLAGRNILTVSDYDGFARAGGMIEFTRVNSRIGVRINVEAVQGANLAVEDRLLRLASTVRTGAP
jgi:hypothetical protein